MIAMNATMIDLTPNWGGEGVSVEDALRFALCALRNFSSAVSISSLNLAPFASLREDLFFVGSL